MKNNIPKIAFIIFLVGAALFLTGWILQINQPRIEPPGSEAAKPTESPQSNPFDDAIASAKQSIDHGDYAAAEELLSQLKNANDENELVYVTYGKLYIAQKKYHAAKSILLEGKRKCTIIEDVNEQLGIVDEMIEKGESID